MTIVSSTKQSFVVSYHVAVAFVFNATHDLVLSYPPLFSSLQPSRRSPRSPFVPPTPPSPLLPSRRRRFPLTSALPLGRQPAWHRRPPLWLPWRCSLRPLWDSRTSSETVSNMRLQICIRYVMTQNEARYTHTSVHTTPVGRLTCPCPGS